MNPKFMSYLEDNFEYQEASDGNELRLTGECPFCHRDRYDLKLFINVKTGKGFCMHCSEGFNPMQFIMEHSGCSYYEAKALLYEDAKVSQFIKDDAPVTDSAMWFPAVVALTPEATEYLTLRGMDGALAEHFGLVSCVKDTRVGDRIVRTSNRIIIVIRDANGDVAAWQGRDITGSAIPKYLFPKNFKGREYVYNIHAIPDNVPYLIICEGVFDVFGWWRAGFKNVVATFGKKISSEQLALIRAKAPGVLLIAWDTDASWEKCDFCEDNIDLFNIRIINLEGQDADELTRADLLNAFKAAQAYSWEAKILSVL